MASFLQTLDNGKGFRANRLFHIGGDHICMSLINPLLYVQNHDFVVFRHYLVMPPYGHNNERLMILFNSYDFGHFSVMKSTNDACR